MYRGFLIVSETNFDNKLLLFGTMKQKLFICFSRLEYMILTGFIPDIMKVVTTKKELKILIIWNILVTVVTPLS